MEINACAKREYENKARFERRKNKANSKHALSAVEWANFEWDVY